MIEKSDLWWRVAGLQHVALVRAATKEQALEKAIAGPVAAWEDPEAVLIGPELPDVVLCA